MRSIAIACGGTGGHLFPGLAVADQLVTRGCAVTLLISPKEVDQHAVRHARGLNVVTLPAVALTGRNPVAFARGFWKSYRASRRLFAAQRPDAVLAMGGFTSAPPVLAGRRAGAATFLHESNTIPGRANRWLSWLVDDAFVGFAEALPRLHARHVTVSGTPVRPGFRSRDAAPCRRALGLDADRPVLLVMGGSQGATGINDLALKTLPLLARRAPALQCLHLTGGKDFDRVRGQLATLPVHCTAHPFLDEMELALGAATVAITRAGASSLAELAAMQVPAILIPFPVAADDHQLYNARAFAASGAARLLEQRTTTPDALAQAVCELLGDANLRETMRDALTRWHVPDAAERIAGAMLKSIPAGRAKAPTQSAHHLPSDAASDDQRLAREARFTLAGESRAQGFSR